MATLELRGLVTTYPTGDRAVDGIDLTVADHELCVIVGPPGCGKSTLLRTIAGLEQPTAGDVLIDGRRVNELRTRDRRIAMSFEHHAHYPRLTVAENIGFPLRKAGVSRSELRRMLRDNADLVDISDLLDVRPRQLSGARCPRIAMARAIVRRPRLVLLDEPTIGAGPCRQRTARTATTRLLRLRTILGATSLYVTHDRLEAQSLGDRVVVMRSGRIAQTGAPSEVYAAPRDVFVAACLGAPTINLFRGLVVVDDQGCGVVLGTARIPIDDAPTAGVATSRPGCQVIVGIRPEALRRDDRGPLVASVETVERLGHDQIVRTLVSAVSYDPGAAESHHPRGWAPMAAYAGSGGPIDQWRPLRFAVEPSGLHLFDVDTGRSLAPATA